eukprot:Ihof_evm6s257 gene=Ihof_evmTU6s257
MAAQILAQSKRVFKLALIQMKVTNDKALNLNVAMQHIEEAANNGADVVALPECFNSPYGASFFPQYAECYPGPSTKRLAEIAKKCKVFVVGGSIPEECDGKFYNTCFIYNREGNMVARHRKVHLFDIDVPGKITFKESNTLTGGTQLTTFDTGFCKIGVGICYDIRFSEMAAIYAAKGCGLLIYPGAFNMTTGPAHWELLLRSRANDNQLYVAAPSPARDPTALYTAWGHSTITDP